MFSFPLPRIDKDEKLKEMLQSFSRFKKGDIWEDPEGKHRIGCLDAASESDISRLMDRKKAVLAVHDPPYNFIAFQETDSDEFVDWSRRWIKNTFNSLKDDSALYVWLGADQQNNFQPFPEFILMMKDTGFKSRSYITMRNQRGYGTQQNWMAIRQELLYYTKGKPIFNIDAEYTDIPKVLKGYYKEVNGKKTENMERSKSVNIRAGNVWIDIQQVFYRMEENVNGCYAQKPLKALDRIIESGSKNKDIILDFFSHSGTTLLAAERLHRKCYTSDYDPLYCEISLRRLEHYRQTGKTGWQNSNPFADDIFKDSHLLRYLENKYNLVPETDELHKTI